MKNFVCENCLCSNYTVSDENWEYNDYEYTCNFCDHEWTDTENVPCVVEPDYELTDCPFIHL